MARELLKISSSEDDEALVRGCSDVLRSVEELASSVEYKTYLLHSGVELNLESEGMMNFSQLLGALESVGVFGDKKQIQLRS